MKSSELNKIMRMLNFPDRFKKKGRLAYYKILSVAIPTKVLESSCDGKS